MGSALLQRKAKVTIIGKGPSEGCCNCNRVSAPEGSGPSLARMSKIPHTQVSVSAGIVPARIGSAALSDLEGRNCLTIIPGTGCNYLTIIPGTGCNYLTIKERKHHYLYTFS